MISLSTSALKSAGRLLLRMALVVFVAFAIVFHPGLARAEMEFSVGHVDAFHVREEGGQLRLGLKEDVTGHQVKHSDDAFTLRVKAAAYTDQTANIQGIGVPSYLLPLTQDQNLLWPGWDTLELQGTGLDAVNIVFDSIDGPGDVFLFTSGTFGGMSPLLSNGDTRITSGAQIHQAIPSHVHANWAFTQPGTYVMNVYAENNASRSNTVRYTWIVEQADGAPASSGDSASMADNSQNAVASPAGTSTNGNAAGNSGNSGNSTNQSGNQNGQCVPGLVPKIKNDTVQPPEWINADGVNFYISDKGEVDLPQSIGPVPQGKAWMIGSVQVPGVPWLGANTQHTSMPANGVRAVDWELVGFDGPGEMVVYSQGNLGQVVGEEWFRGAGNKAQGVHTVPENTHAHPNWLFSQPGTYKVTIRQSSVTKDNKQVAGQATLIFHVGGSQPANSFAEGHFDLGAEVNPNGGACAGGSGASQSGGSQSGGNSSANGNTAGGSAGGNSAGATGNGASGSGANGQLANTGSSILNVGVATMGFGLFVLGLAMAYTAAQRQREV
ncbi:MAG: choice-of-anchor M domain-containing protein [Corynebacterium sp.]|nr:choice-of-anchor M domain-containing protein [Corynebacterium sp.]